ncbi:site-specific DNA-methyltransferase [uncultured Cohaesibacter sp.]|uniref:DNA-methyltransferase n=1 Tax=uncultured Cohaesibacter sp. TaxID=1002546 RepID=UPI0029C60971|nr:site-specific DNA-methyltransferase [uncultured Cohaesibacter sp.]
MILHLADARNITVRDAALLVADPPYQLSQGGKSLDPRAMQGGWMADYDNKGLPVTCEIGWPEIMDICYRALAAQSHAYVFVNDKNMHPALAAALAAGFRIHNVLVWYKRTATANRWYMKNAEFILFLGKGPAFKINNCSSMACIEMYWPDETAHPTEKPWPLLERYIRNSSEPGAMVFDPFMGAGSTGVAAAKNGRDFVGVEIERQWFDVASTRIAKAAREFSVFGGGGRRARRFAQRPDDHTA